MRFSPRVLGGLGGALLLVNVSSPRFAGSAGPPLLGGGSGLFEFRGGIGWGLVAGGIAVTVLALLLVRWWPYLLTAGAVLSVPELYSELIPNSGHIPTAVWLAGNVRAPLIAIGLLACAQSLIRSGSTGWGAAVAGLGLGGEVFGTALLGPSWLMSPATLPRVHVALLMIALVLQVPAIRAHRRGDESVDGGPWGWSRIRFLVTGALAACLVVPLSFFTLERLSGLLDVTQSALYRHGDAAVAVVGAIEFAAALVLAAVAGLWALGGAITASLAQIALVAPTLLAITALDIAGPARWLGGLAGVALGAAVAASRWRTPVTMALTVAGAVAMFIAYAATTGHPEKVAEQRQTTPAVLLLVGVAAAATAVVGCTALTLAPRGGLPAVLGPITGVLVAGGLRTVEVTYVNASGLPESNFLNPVFHLNTSAVLMLLSGLAVGVLGLAQFFAARRTERKRTEQIQREAAAAERDRLARPIHDGVLQVLALVQRHGSELGGEGRQLAELAGEQETALRNLLTGRVDARAGADLRAAMLALASPAIDVAAPAEPVLLPGAAAAELAAAVQAALDNVRRHAGPDAHTWILLEDEGDGVRVTVRDDGVGFAAGRLDEAADGGRLGVAQSMRGRVTDLGGTTTIHSAPGQGTEVELWVPRAGRARP